MSVPPGFTYNMDSLLPLVAAQQAPTEYEVEVELNVTDVGAVDYLRRLLNNRTFSLAVGPTVNVTHIDINTVCYPNGTNFQCICEDQYVWSHTNCITYGACDAITNSTCRCINSIPTNGEYCQLKTVPPIIYEYQIFVEVETTDADQLRNTLKNITFPAQINTQVNISTADITTVCSQDGAGFQCRCEDDYLWPCDKCATYGKCDSDTNNTCSCIRAIPTDGQYCQSIQHQNVYEYIISVELNISDVSLIDQLRTIVNNISSPISINNHIQISEVNISTVCSPSSGGFQCRCEDQYIWSCDQCLTYGSCDNSTYDTCGCINALPPDGQYCQPVDQYTPPVVYEYIISVELNISDVSLIDRLRTIVNNISSPISINNHIQISEVNISTAPPVVYEYIISVELNISDVSLIDQLRTIVNNISSPISINNHIQISEVNISTVCYPNAMDRFNTFYHNRYEHDNNCYTNNNGNKFNNHRYNRCEHNFNHDISNNCSKYNNKRYNRCEHNHVYDNTNNNFNNRYNGCEHNNSSYNGCEHNNIHHNGCEYNNSRYNKYEHNNSRYNRCEHNNSSYNGCEHNNTCYNGCEYNNSRYNGCEHNNSRYNGCEHNNSRYNGSATTGVNTTTPATTGVNTTTPATTDVNTTTAATTGVNTTTAATTGVSTTTAATTGVNTTTAATTGVNTTTAATTGVSTTTAATTGVNTTTAATTGVSTTTAATTGVNTTTVDTTGVNTTTAATTGVSTTTAATTDVSTTTGATTGVNTTTGATTGVSTTTVDTTGVSTTTVATTPVTTTDVTSGNTTISSTTSDAPTTPTPTTSAATTTTITSPTTTTTMGTTTITTPTTTTTATTTATSPTTTTTTTTSTATTSALSTTTATPTSPTQLRGIDLEMSIRLDMEYTSELNDPTSAEYRALESRILPVVKDLYKEISGYIGVSVTRFSEGSVITDFVVETTQVVPGEITNAIKNLPDAMLAIAPVIGPVSAFYRSPTSISIPNLTYTGNTMTLTCGPPKKMNVGKIDSSAWKFKGREIKDDGRMEITTSDNISKLKVNNVILADRGYYSCTLRIMALGFFQEGDVTEANIKQAPIVRLQSEVNVRCENEAMQPLTCCVQRPFTVEWFLDGNRLESVPIDDGEANCIRHDYNLGSCSGSPQKTLLFICRVVNPRSYEMTMTMTIFQDDVRCDDAQYGVGRAGDRSSIECAQGQEGSKTAICQETGEWKLQEDTCIVTEIKELLIDSQDLAKEEVPQFVANLNKTVQQQQTKIANSSATISAVVDILNTVATVSTTVNETVMHDVISTIDAIVGEDARESWATLNANETRNSSSALLGSLETISDQLVGEFSIATTRILLNRTTFDNSFRADLNSSIVIDIPNTNMNKVSITTITLSTLNNVMPLRNSTFDASLFNATSNETVSDNAINAAVVLVKINATIRNVSLSYDKLNNSLTLNPQCVFWNFTLFDNLGAWDDEGCEFVSDKNNTVTCRCNHLTSFSILMATNIPPSLRVALDIITYVGVGISLASLVICLIIEGCVWKAITRNSTAFMRHVSIVNTALSLLIADICFLIGASIAKNPLENPGEDHAVPLAPCSTATFFMHFFYLSLFFWMLVSGLLLFYRTVMVFSHMSKATMLAIGFCLGYGCPLIIAVITVAVTAPGNGYIRKFDACWLNWNETKALLAMVVPALTIVFINILIVVVVLFKMLRRGTGTTAHPDEKHTLVVITRCVIILTPLFGLTWSLGVGTMVSPTNKGIHIAFAFFNSLQGFFILVFGTLFDSKIRSILSRRVPTTSTGTGSNSTGSTSGGNSSFSGTNFISRLLGRRYIYHVSQAASSNSGGASESFVNI
ncbi:adhesion G protein-coupled receptor F5-like [Seriola dumerili]|uniref:adhesion G protein-coupled receptor F5-like n=1 Tax=Seriola dumerili TaxID=41447 RepID=UPI000BBE1E66|nr:adhesion G protein-coupled receptor F5-like [Seriola dumerili]